MGYVLGHYSSSDIPKEDRSRFIKEETELVISDIYFKHRLIHSYQNSDALQEARKKLLRMAESLLPIEEKIKSIPKQGKS